MGHQHDHHHHATENIKVAFFLNLSFTVLELVGGFFTNSMAILSDAVHDLGDSLSLALAWYFQNKSQQGVTATYTYGYKRFSLLGAMINSIVLFVGSIFILSAAIPRLFHPQEAHAAGMFWLAIVGLLVNGAAVFRLKKGNSLNERVVSLHLLEDVLGWAAILVGSVVMYFYHLPILDPIMSVLIAGFVLFNVFKNVRQTLRILLQGSPVEHNLTALTDKIRTLKSVADVHDVHLWSLDGVYNVLTLHVVLNYNANLDELAALKTSIKSTLQNDGIQHTTIEFETANETCHPCEAEH